MKASSPIGSRFTRMFGGGKIQFPCPACFREILIRKTDAGGNLNCPHCTAAIAAPNPDQHLEAVLHDPGMLAARQHQESFGLNLADLKRGRFKLSVERKQQRDLERKGDAPQEVEPESVPEPEIPAAAPESPETTPPAGKLYPVPVRSAPMRLGETEKRGIDERAAKGFQPVDDVDVVVNSDRLDTPWDEDREPVALEASPFAWVAKALWLAGGVAVLVFLGLMIDREFDATFDQVEQGIVLAEKKTAEEEAWLRRRKVELATAEGALAVARQALASKEWQGILPHVRHPERVLPFLQEYYATFPWKPVSFSASLPGNPHQVGDRSFLAFDAVDQATGKPFVIGLEKTDAGWKLDWEILVPLADVEWSRFVAEHPARKRLVRVSAIRRTPTPDMLRRAGIPADKGYGVMLWGSDLMNGSVYTVLHRDSALARELDASLSVSSGRKLIVEASFMPARDRSQTEVLQLHRLIRTGWTLMDEDPPFEPPTDASEIARNALGLPSTDGTASPGNAMGDSEMSVASDESPSEGN